MRWMAWMVVGLAACESMPSSGRVFEPVTVAGPAPVAAPAGVVEAEPLVPGEAPPDEGTDEADSDDPLALQARLAGVTANELSSPPPAPAMTSPAPAAAPLLPVPVQVPVWDPGTPPEASSWGLRLLSTLAGSMPPRAVLVLPDGSEVVVKAGDILSDEKVVVWAVGRDRVELAHISADGPFAAVETKALEALLPSAP